MQDNSELVSDIFNDGNQQNGNKLRTYRLLKACVKTELYVRNNIPRSVRRTMTLFKVGRCRWPLKQDDIPDRRYH